MGKYQRVTMWTVGSLLGLGFLGDALDYFVYEQPTEIDVVAEIGWTVLFLATVTTVEGIPGSSLRHSTPIRRTDPRTKLSVLTTIK